MKYNPEKHHRQSIRMKEFDYASENTYFITICTENRINLFGEVTVGAGLVSALMALNNAGKMIESVWEQTIVEYKNFKCDKYIIMPNHLHEIITIENANDGRADTRPAPTICDLICAFKSKTTTQYINGVKSGVYPPFNKRIWQRNYYEHIIRDEQDYQTKWNYIDTNPINWENDEYK